MNWDMSWDDVKDWKREPLKDAWVGKVVGVSFIDGYPNNLVALATKPLPILASITRNPNNQYDSNACEVWVDDAMIGHIDKDTAAELAPQLDAGTVFEITVTSIGFANNDPTKPGAGYIIRKKG